MDVIAGNVLQGLTSFAHEEFKLLRNVKHDVESMKNTIRAIRATLLDAEQQANNHNHQVGFWLARLKDLLYDADDFLDDLSAEALRRRIMTQNKAAKKVRIFFSESNQAVYKLKMAHKLRELRGRLDDINDDRKNFNFIDHPLKPLSVVEERKQTYSFVHEGEIIGREEENNTILHYLLENSKVKSSVSIIPIVGFGGLGKTALAQLVYNHKQVQDNFELRKWVCVSDEFDVRKVAQNILGQEVPKEMEKVQQDLRQLIEGKKFLIVLDDVWNEDNELWGKLKSLLTQGGEGSTIIVTTRSAQVGKMMGTYEPIILQGLDGERSLQLFCRTAFDGGKESSDMDLLEIGKEVVQKCAGVPLAIRVVASLVREKTLEGITDLSYLRNCELWNADRSLEDRIFAVLKLSYDHLPPPLKNCIALCSLFPKDFLFQKQTLIQMWVAEGFVESTNQLRCEEDVGDEYFMNLLSRSFFQDVKRDLYDNIVSCKMHDLINDLAKFVAAKPEHLVIGEGKEESTDKDATRHLSYHDVPEFGLVPTSVLKFDKLRTMLVLGCIMYPSIFESVASKMRCLRVLNLRQSGIGRIPESIGKLKQLRFLDISGNGVWQIPSAICKLHNLQTLNLGDNYYTELPRDISKLVSLRHLQFDCRFYLEWMPRGLGKLTSLQTLTDFVVDPEMQRRRASASMRELGELKSLRGSLRIRGLNHLRSNPEEAEYARLKEKQHLQQLSLVWDDVHYSPFPEVTFDELILERLCPHRTIRALLIKGFYGERLPLWIGNLPELQHLVIINCKYLISLPEGLPKLTSLRSFTGMMCPSLPADEWQKIAHIPSMDGRTLIDLGLNFYGNSALEVGEALLIHRKRHVKKKILVYLVKN